MRRLETGNSLKWEKSQSNGESEEHLEQRRELTIQDDVSRTQQLQTLQQVKQLADPPVPAAPPVHHPIGPLLLFLSQSQSCLIIEHHRGYEAGKGNSQTDEGTDRRSLGYAVA